MSEVLLDTSALIEFFDGSDAGAIVCNHIEDGAAATTLLNIAELADVFTRAGRTFDAEHDFLQQHVRIVPLTFSACAGAGAFKQSHRRKQPGFGLVDAILFLTAQEQGLRLLTKDREFSSLKHVEII
jgi:predicted nucleic acid-binding protein